MSLNSINYSKQFLILVLWAVGVGLVFKFAANRQIAGLIAGVVFILIPSLFLRIEFKKKPIQYIYVTSLLVFMIFSAVPIFLLRILNWGIDFKELSLFGVTADQLHRFSNILYILMMITVAYCWWRQSKNTK